MSEHTTELLNCPFCGAADSVQTEIDPAGSLTTDAGTTRFNESWMVVCNVNKGGCGASSGVQHATEASAIAAWNRRSYATALCQQGEPELPRLTDEQVETLVEGMPGGLKGFCIGWGWLQFARRIEDALMPQRAVLGQSQDAKRYRWLRRLPTHTTDYITTGLPWVVHIEREHGVPTMTALANEALDAAIDAALSTSKGKTE